MEYRSRPFELAQELHGRYCFIRPPVNPGIVIVDYPLKVVLRDWNDEIAGVFARGRNISHIGLNSNHPITKRHWTLWHEFFHFHEHTFLHFCKFGASRRLTHLEREADAFAVNMLMPESWIKEYHAINNGNLIVLSKLFGVSKEAMHRRVKALGIKQ